MKVNRELRDKNRLLQRQVKISEVEMHIESTSLLPFSYFAEMLNNVAVWFYLFVMKISFN